MIISLFFIFDLWKSGAMRKAMGLYMGKEYYSDTNPKNNWYSSVVTVTLGTPKLADPCAETPGEAITKSETSADDGVFCIIPDDIDEEENSDRESRNSDESPLSPPTLSFDQVRKQRNEIKIITRARNDSEAQPTCEIPLCSSTIEAQDHDVRTTLEFENVLQDDIGQESDVEMFLSCDTSRGSDKSEDDQEPEIKQKAKFRQRDKWFEGGRRNSSSSDFIASSESAFQTSILMSPEETNIDEANEIAKARDAISNLAQCDDIYDKEKVSEFPVEIQGLQVSNRGLVKESITDTKDDLNSYPDFSTDTNIGCSARMNTAENVKTYREKNTKTVEGPITLTDTQDAIENNEKIIFVEENLGAINEDRYIKDKEKSLIFIEEKECFEALRKENESNREEIAETDPKSSLLADNNHAWNSSKEEENDAKASISETESRANYITGTTSECTTFTDLRYPFDKDQEKSSGRILKEKCELVANEKNEVDDKESSTNAILRYFDENIEEKNAERKLKTYSHSVMNEVCITDYDNIESCIKSPANKVEMDERENFDAYTQTLISKTALNKCDTEKTFNEGSIIVGVEGNEGTIDTKKEGISGPGHQFQTKIDLTIDNSQRFTNKNFDTDIKEPLRKCTSTIDGFHIVDRKLSNRDIRAVSLEPSCLALHVVKSDNKERMIIPDTKKGGEDNDSYVLTDGVNTPADIFQNDLQNDSKIERDTASEGDHDVTITDDNDEGLALQGVESESKGRVTNSNSMITEGENDENHLFITGVNTPADAFRDNSLNDFEIERDFASEGDPDITITDDNDEDLALEGVELDRKERMTTSDSMITEDKDDEYHLLITGDDRPADTFPNEFLTDSEIEQDSAFEGDHDVTITDDDEDLALRGVELESKERVTNSSTIGGEEDVSQSLTTGDDRLADTLPNDLSTDFEIETDYGSERDHDISLTDDNEGFMRITHAKVPIGWDESLTEYQKEIKEHMNNAIDALYAIYAENMVEVADRGVQTDYDINLMFDKKLKHPRKKNARKGAFGMELRKMIKDTKEMNETAPGQSTLRNAKMEEKVKNKQLTLRNSFRIGKQKKSKKDQDTNTNELKISEEKDLPKASTMLINNQVDKKPKIKRSWSFSGRDKARSQSTRESTRTGIKKPRKEKSVWSSFGSLNRKGELEKVDHATNVVRDVQKIDLKQSNQNKSKIMKRWSFSGKDKNFLATLEHTTDEHGADPPSELNNQSCLNTEYLEVAIKETMNDEKIVTASGDSTEEFTPFSYVAKETDLVNEGSTDRMKRKKKKGPSTGYFRMGNRSETKRNSSFNDDELPRSVLNKDIITTKLDLLSDSTSAVLTCEADIKKKSRRSIFEKKKTADILSSLDKNSKVRHGYMRKKEEEERKEESENVSVRREEKMGFWSTLKGSKRRQKKKVPNHAQSLTAHNSELKGTTSIDDAAFINGPNESDQVDSIDANGNTEISGALENIHIDPRENCSNIAKNDAKSSSAPDSINTVLNEVHLVKSDAVFQASGERAKRQEKETKVKLASHSKSLNAIQVAEIILPSKHVVSEDFHDSSIICLSEETDIDAISEAINMIGKDEFSSASEKIDYESEASKTLRYADETKEATVIDWIMIEPNGLTNTSIKGVATSITEKENDQAADAVIDSPMECKVIYQDEYDMYSGVKTKANIGNKKEHAITTLV